MKRNRNDYTDFTREQFAADEYFQQWVLQPDDDLGQFWESFLLLHPNRNASMLDARRLVEGLAAHSYDAEPLTTEEKAAIKLNIFQGLQLPISDAMMMRPAKKNWQRWSVAAAVLATVAASAFFMLRPEKKTALADRQPDAMQTVQTGFREMKRIVLPDSTVVLLNANSSLRYNGAGAEIRDVELEGNAFFDVKKGAGQAPFVVHTRALAITVLGTELNVNARSMATAVELATGKVKVEQAGHAAAAEYLQPGEKIQLDTTTRGFVRSKTDARLYSAWTEGIWSFRQTTLEQITSLLHEYYGVDVRFNSDRHRFSRIDAVIPVSSLQRLVPVIERTLQAKMELTNNQLIIE